MGISWNIKHGMSEKTREHVDLLCALLDEILNAILFVLIGLEVLVLHFERLGLSAALSLRLPFSAVPLARLVGVGVPMTLLRLRAGLARGSVGRSPGPA